MTNQAPTPGNATQGDSLNPAYVAGYYDTLLGKDSRTYTERRWFKDARSRSHYRQTKRTFERALSLVKGKVLEIGGGDGLWTKQVLPKCDHLDFVDVSEEMLKRAKETLPADKVTFAKGDFMTTNLPSAQYDAIVSVRNLEYFPDKVAFAVRCRLLNPNGPVIIVTKNPHFDWNTAYSEDTLHTGQIDRAAVIAAFEKAGYVTRSVEPAIIGKWSRFFIPRFVFELLHIIVLGLGSPRFLISTLDKITESYVYVFTPR